MPSNDRDKLNRIEELKGKLFSKNYKTKIEHRNSFSHLHKADIPEEWENGPKVGDGFASYKDKLFMKTSIFKNFFIFSLIFFVATLGYASYVFFAGGNTVSNKNIDISIVGNNYTAGGEELSLVVGITNKNSSALDLVDLILEYPKSSTSSEAGSALPTDRLRISVGNIPAGALRNENVKVVLFGEQGTVRPLKFSLEYRVEGSNAIFVKEKNYEVTINSTPLDLAIDAPLKISSNQNITLDVKATLNASRPASGIILIADYPVGFKFESSVPSPTLGNNIWSLGDLAPGAERNISITGKMLDVVNGEEKIFHVKSGLQSSSDKSLIGVVFNSVSHAVAIEKPFIEAELFVNGVHQREYATSINTPVRGEIRWRNNLDTKVNDLVIKATISGNAFNRKTINADRGFYNSLGGQDVITWDKNYVDSFDEVNPGDSGSVNFSFSPTSLFSATSGILSDPSIKVDISISGKQLVSGYETADLKNSDSGVVRIISDVGFAAKALYFSGSFKNKGPIPPKVEQETTYTINWSLSNTANNISKAVVNSTLPSWIRFVGPISPSTEDLTFNASTKEIIWNVGRIPKGTGVTMADRNVSFQVAFIPSLSQVGTIPVLINEAVLTGHDDFANVDVRASKASLRTQLDSDPLFPQNGSTVVD